MKILYVFLVASVVFTFCAPQNLDTYQPDLEIMKPDSLAIFGEGIISTKYYERDMAISPDGNELFYSLVSPRNRSSAIIQLNKVDGKWGNPKIADFSGPYSDLEPAYHPNGGQLFFISNRSVNQDSTKADFDIWYVNKEKDGWSKAIRMDTVINSSKDEYYPSITNEGTIYFTGSYEGGVGREDIYKSVFIDGIYQPPTVLDTNVNSTMFEYNAFISPDESFLLFGSFGREDGHGGGDLYISRKDRNGQWEKAENLGPEINTNRLDYCPFVVGDSILFFTSERTTFDTSPNYSDFKSLKDRLESAQNGNGDIYWTPFN